MQAADLIDVSHPDSFATRRDPFSIDFEKIALRRAAKQAEFHHKYDDEAHPHDLVHGGRYSYHDEHLADDKKEMEDHPDHAALHAAFRQSEEEYH